MLKGRERTSDVYFVGLFLKGRYILYFVKGNTAQSVMAAMGHFSYPRSHLCCNFLPRPLHNVTQ